MTGSQDVAVLSGNLREVPLSRQRQQPVEASPGIIVSAVACLVARGSGISAMVRKILEAKRASRRMPMPAANRTHSQIAAEQLPLVACRTQAA